MLERQRIRELVVSHLVAQGVVAAGRVYDSRVYPVASSGCPAINVYTPSDMGKSENAINHTPSFDHDLSLRVDIHVVGGKDWAASGDTLAEVIDAAIMTDAAFLAQLNVTGFTWHNTKIQASGEGQDVVCVIGIEFGLSFSWDHEPVVEDAFVGVDISLDAINPADPNTGHENDPGGYTGGSPGPDGRIEGHVSANPEQ